MLRNIKALTGYTLQTQDGPMGKVADFYFDDQEWIVRYLVVTTGAWLSERKVLISRLALGQPDWTAPLFPVELSKQQVENSLKFDPNMPIGPEYETQLYNYYNAKSN